ncbi:hypothetical protein AgCh_004680 [Apium graveolens]
MLKTYELEMDQRSKRHGRKSRTVDLKAEEESPKMDTSKRGKGKALIIKSDSKSSYSDDDDSETESLPEIDADEEMMKLCALMVNGITKIAYRKFRKGKKFYRKSGSSYKKGIRKSEGKGGKSDRGDNSNVKCYNCGVRGHISPDYKKGKSDKGRALITKKNSWTDTSDSEHEVNYALMENADSSPETAELKGDVQGNRVRAQPAGVVQGSGVVHGSGVVGQYAGVYGVTGYGCDVLLGLQIYYLSSANIDGTDEYCERLGWKRLQDYNPPQRRWKNLNYLAQGKMVQEDTLLFEDELQDEDYFPSLLRD